MQPRTSFETPVIRSGTLCLPGWGNRIPSWSEATRSSITGGWGPSPPVGNTCSGRNFPAVDRKSEKKKRKIGQRVAELNKFSIESLEHGNDEKAVLYSQQLCIVIHKFSKVIGFRFQVFGCKTGIKN